MIGSALRGLFVAHKDGISLFHPTMFNGVTNGLCASLTTFSAWNQKANLEMITGHVMNSFLILTLGFAISLTFFRFGTQAGELHSTKHDKVIAWTWTTIGLAAVFTIVVFSTIKQPDNSVYLGAFLFGPVGALVRVYWDWWFNRLEWSKANGWPIGTFLANVVGCIISSLMRMLTDRKLGLAWVESAASVGLAGALSTVSTYLLEIERFTHRHHRYYYAFGSIFFCQLILTVINTHRFYAPYQ